jgi:hypothetical protein
VARTSLPCGNIDLVGITGTPVVDAATRTMFFDAMTTPDGGATKKHLLFALSIDDGKTRPGWPSDVSMTAKFGAVAFDSAVQNQRGALVIVNRTLYVSYGGHAGDCGNYRGWVVSVPIDDPTAVGAWATGTQAAGSGRTAASRPTARSCTSRRAIQSGPPATHGTKAKRSSVSNPARPFPAFRRITRPVELVRARQR